MPALLQRRWVTVLLALFSVLVAVTALHGAVSWYGRPFAGVLVDPDLAVSNLGMPGWEGIRAGLGHPDRVLAVDGRDVTVARSGYQALSFDEAIDRAARAGERAVHVRVATSRGVRELDLPIVPFDPLAWWIDAGSLLLIGAMYFGAGLLAIAVSPDGPLARTFAKTATWAGLFLLTIFDYHTTRRLVPLFHLAFAMAPMAFVALALRLPDDARVLRRAPWLLRALDLAGLALAAALLLTHAAGGSTIHLRALASALGGGSLLFFAVVFAVRYAYARGDRRATMRALVIGMVPSHLILGGGLLVGLVASRPGMLAMCAFPALALAPASTVVAFIRHDLWGSRAMLSRVLTRAVLTITCCTLAIALAGGIAAGLGVPLGGALFAGATAVFVSAGLVFVVLGAGDQQLFPSRAQYKPTVEQLSEELTELTMPDEVASAVERTVRRWLPCDRIEFREVPDLGSGEGSGPRPVVAIRSDGASELSLPVTFRGRTLALLSVGQKRGGALFTSEDRDLLHTIANQAALALAHAQSYAELEQRRREQVAALREEKSALVETVAAEIAHEVRYPINFFRSIFKRGSSGEQLDAEEVDIGCEEVERLERLVSGLRRVAVRPLDRRDVRVRDLVQKTEMLLRDRLGARRVALALEDDDVAIRCDPDHAIQLLVNLLSNGLDAAGPRGQVGVRWERTEVGAVVSVWDTGPGLSSDPSRLFAPWFTTKVGGTGLGLAITQRLVRAHGWSIDPVRREGRTAFEIAIPARDVVTQPRAVEHAPEEEVA